MAKQAEIKAERATDLGLKHGWTKLAATYHDLARRIAGANLADPEASAESE